MSFFFSRLSTASCHYSAWIQKQVAMFFFFFFATSFARSKKVRKQKKSSVLKRCKSKVNERCTFFTRCHLFDLSFIHFMLQQQKRAKGMNGCVLHDVTPSILEIACKLIRTTNTRWILTTNERLFVSIYLMAREYNYFFTWIYINVKQILSDVTFSGTMVPTNIYHT